MANFLAELKRRHIYRVAAAYAVVAWVLLQLFNNVAPILESPPWVARTVLLLLVLGFPVALIFAWMRELAPADGTTARAATGKLDWALIGALVVVIALVSYQQLAPLQTTQTEQGGVDAARAASASPAGAISVAVLPFANVSADPEQEFFSDGITDEISGVLAKIPDLRVVGRTSAFQFKTRNTDLRSIGQSLNATHLIEGSVRSAGGRVRISVQLILADNGLQLWSENYDRELIDVFAIQEDIARAIASSLNMQLGLAPGENLVSSRTTNTEFYQQFLRARAQFRGRLGGGRISLEELIARDPGFAPAWGLMAQGLLVVQGLETGMWARGVEETRRLVQSRLEETEKAAREAIRLDPRLAVAYSALAEIEAHRRHWTASVDLYRKSLELDPNDPDILSRYSVILGTIGHLKDNLRVVQEARALEPTIPPFSNQLAFASVVNGENETAIRILESFRAGGGQESFRNETLGRAYASVGRYADAAQAILLINRDRYGDTGKSIAAAAALIRTAPTKVSDPEALPVLPGRLNYVYTYVGAPDRIMEVAEQSLEAGFGDVQGQRSFWSPANAPVRKTERFKAYVRKAGLVDYWRARVWPDLCRPVGSDDFVCE